MAEPWTPGPWKVAERERFNFEEVYGPAVVAADGSTVAAVEQWGLPDGKQGYQLHDARLIALAPEMAECLALVAASSMGATASMALDLLARARGEV